MSDKKTVLLIEDDPEDVELTLLAMRGTLDSCEVVVAYDGVEALDYLFGQGSHAGRDKGKRPELIIMDLNLPRIGGLEVLQRLHEQWGPGLFDVKIAILSSAPVEQYRSTLKRLGVDAYLQKPISKAQSDVMIHEIARLLAGANDYGAGH